MANVSKILGIALVGIGVGAYALRGNVGDPREAGETAEGPSYPAPEGERGPTSTEEAAAQVEHAPLSAPSLGAVAEPAPSASAVAAEPDEAALMAKIREIGESNPELSIQLAREGNTRYPNSPEAAERAWRIAKSLVNLKRFHEARDEAKIMVEKYRGTEWANDVARHLLVHPLDYPSREDLQRMAAEADAQ